MKDTIISICKDETTKMAITVINVAIIVIVGILFIGAVIPFDVYYMCVCTIDMVAQIMLTIYNTEDKVLERNNLLHVILTCRKAIFCFGMILTIIIVNKMLAYREAINEVIALVVLLGLPVVDLFVPIMVSNHFTKKIK